MKQRRKPVSPPNRFFFFVYVLCGLCATIGGFILLAQSGAVNPQFGKEREFDAISAAVLGGTSLFGGRGHVFPGTVIGAILIKTVDNGLVILQANPYIYPLVTSIIIFLAVLLEPTQPVLKIPQTQKNPPVGRIPLTHRGSSGTAHS